MSIQAPEWLRTTLSAIGFPFPACDESVVEQCGRKIGQIGLETGELVPDIGRSRDRLLVEAVYEGDSASAFNTRVEVEAQSLAREIADDCAKLRKLCGSTYIEVQYAKYSLILTALSFILAAPTAILTRGLLRWLLSRGFGRFALYVHTGLVIAITNLFIDLGIQGVQWARGDRANWDHAKTMAAGFSGLVSGFFAAWVGHAAATRLIHEPVVHKLIAGASVRVRTAVVQTIGGVTGGVGGGASGGAAAVGATIATEEMTTEHGTTSSPTDAVSQTFLGAYQGVLGGLAAGARGGFRAGVPESHLLSEAKHNGGFSRSPTHETSPTEGFMVALTGRTVRHPEKILKNPEEFAASVRDYLMSNQDVLRDQPNVFLGGWVEDGYLWLEPSANIFDQNYAVQLGRDTDQKAIYDVGTGEYIETGGSGGTTEP